MAADIFLKLTGIEGECTDALHRGEMEILSFSSGVSMSIGPRSTSGSATMEKVNLSDVSISKYVDSATPALFRAACTGLHVHEAVLSVNRAEGRDGKIEYLKYILGDVVLSAYSASGADGSGMPVESLSLNFAKFRIEYVSTDPAKGSAKGAKTAGWDVARSQVL